jgi:hypothetical protein
MWLACADSVADLGNLATNFGKTAGATWVNGDFDFDCNGNFNVADLGDLATNFGRSLGFTSGDAIATALAAPSVVVVDSAPKASQTIAPLLVPQPPSMRVSADAVRSSGSLDDLLDLSGQPDGSRDGPMAESH